MSDEKQQQKKGLTYADSGVDIDAGNAFVEAIKPHIKKTSRPGVMGSIGGFGGLFDLAATGYKDPILVAANDGVGTKLKLAFEINQHRTVGIDLVAMCVNDLIVQGAEPLFFLDYFATGKLQSGVAQQVVEGIADGCKQAGCALIGGETAEMPGMYPPGEYDLAGFAVGVVERENILPREDISDGDILLGLPSAGPHSNGYSLIRKLVSDGGHSYTDPFPTASGGRNLGEVLLSPTQIYVRPILAALERQGAIKALAHITGGGLSENIPRVLPDNLAVQILLDDWVTSINMSPEIQQIFSWLAQQGRMEQLEMLRTFNCGVGMVLIVDSGNIEAVKSDLSDQGLSSFELGRVTQQEHGESVRYEGKLRF